MAFNRNLNIPKLGECCEIEVNVDDNGNFFFGKIYFSAERIRVKITGEEHGDRKIKVFDDRFIERAKCIDSKRRKLLLFNLRLVSRIRRESRFIVPIASQNYGL